MRSNAYLEMAERALLEARRPLTPQEILSLAADGGFLPQHLFGATMHKTLSARLSEHIRTESARSLFYRTAPGTYFLHSLATDPAIDARHKTVHVGNLRSKTIRKENVLVAPRQDLKADIFGEYVPYDEAEFQRIYRTYCAFRDRADAETDASIKQFVTFTLVFHEDMVLIYRRGKFTTTSDTLKGQLSVGFGGHVADSDFTLFSRDGDAFRANAARELKEELFLDEVYHDIAEAADRTEILGYVNVDDSADARQHVAVLVAFEHKTNQLPRKGELSINQLSWLDLRARRNDLSDFDLWSEMILRNIYEGVIKMPRRAPYV